MSKTNKNSAAKRKSGDTAIIVALIAVLIVVIAVIAISAIGEIRANTGSYLRGEIAASTNNTATDGSDDSIEIDGAMMNYFFNDYYNNFLSYYGSYISYLGLDTSMSLKYQYTSEDQTETWFDYIMSGAKQNVSNLLAINKAAIADGFALTDAEKAAVKVRADEIDTDLYGKGVNKTDIYNAKCIEALAYKYQIAKELELAPSEETINTYYENSANNYQFVDVLTFSLNYIDPENAEKSTATLTKEEAKEYIDKLAAATDAESFKTLAKEATLAAEPEIPEEDLTNKIDALATEGKTYSDDDFSKWAYGEEAAVNATYTEDDETNSAFVVYMLTKTPYRSEVDTVNVRHILLLASGEKELEKAHKKAEEILADFKAGEATAEAFGLLALEYSEDTGSCYSGGLYNNVAPGEMVQAFDAWCFDENRVPGDTGIVETEYGVHIMYYVDDGLVDWQASVSVDILNEALTALSTEWNTAYTVEFDPNVLAAIPG